jgi:hypothetical protein
MELKEIREKQSYARTVEKLYGIENDRAAISPSPTRHTGNNTAAHID